MKEHLPHPAIDNQQQTELLHELLGPQPTVVAIEGGPCSGKSTLLEHIRQAADRTGQALEELPEAATRHLAELGASGRTISDLIEHDRPGFLAFEAAILQTIVSNITEARQRHAGTDTLIVTDRADIGAYVTSSEYRSLLRDIGLSAPPAIAYVDKLVYLPSVARENPPLYDALKATNATRYETLAEAAATCQATLRSVGSHPEISVFWGGTFTRKMNEATQQILNPYRRTAARFVQQADANGSVLESNIPDLEPLGTTDITQSYHPVEGLEVGLRQGITSEGWVYQNLSVTSDEGDYGHGVRRLITGEQYEELTAMPQRRMLHKTSETFLGTILERRRIIARDTYHNLGRPLVMVEIDGITDMQAAGLNLPGYTAE